jgi:hypothetical protein
MEPLYKTPMPAFTDIAAAFNRVCDGYIRPAEPTHEAADALWVRLATEGRVVGRVNDGTRGHLQVRAALIAHPALPPSEVYATFGMGDGTLSVYRCAAEDARLAIQHPSAFNL